jgi:hypothetical protein
MSSRCRRRAFTASRSASPPGAGMNGSRANLAFSVFASLASLAVTVLSALKGAYAVTAVFGLLAIGFVLRASERRWWRR